MTLIRGVVGMEAKRRLAVRETEAQATRHRYVIVIEFVYIEATESEIDLVLILLCLRALFAAIETRVTLWQ